MYFLSNGLSMKCPFYEMPFLWNVLSMKCPFYEMSYQWNVLWYCYLYKMSFYEMSQRQYGGLFCFSRKGMKLICKPCKIIMFIILLHFLLLNIHVKMNFFTILENNRIIYNKCSKTKQIRLTFLGKVNKGKF